MESITERILNAQILIVDDQEPNISLLEQLLAETGCTSVTSTMNPQEVCELHRKKQYDLILLDLQIASNGWFSSNGMLKNQYHRCLPSGAGLNRSARP